MYLNKKNGQEEVELKFTTISSVAIFSSYLSGKSYSSTITISNFKLLEYSLDIFGSLLNIIADDIFNDRKPTPVVVDFEVDVDIIDVVIAKCLPFELLIWQRQATPWLIIRPLAMFLVIPQRKVYGV